MWREQCPKEARLQTAFAVFCQSSSIWKPVASTRAAMPFWNSQRFCCTTTARRLTRNQLLHYQAAPLPGTNMDPASLRFIGIDPYNPARKAGAEPEVFQEFFREVRRGGKARRLQPRNRGCPQRGLRPSVHHVGRQPQRHQTQSIPPVFIHRHGVACRRCVRADGAQPSLRLAPASPTTAMKRIRPVTTRRDGRAVLRDRQSLAGYGRLAAARVKAISRRWWACPLWPRAAAPAISVFSSPDWYISVTMSQPPTSSPSTHSCGNVGQFA